MKREFYCFSCRKRFFKKRRARFEMVGFVRMWVAIKHYSKTIKNKWNPSRMFLQPITTMQVSVIGSIHVRFSIHMFWLAVFVY